MKIKFSFIVVNYNAYQYTAQCLTSIKKYCDQYSYEILVIDNASSDDSVRRLEERFSDVVLIKSKENLGFARACNLGIEKAGGEFLIFLNNDFEFTTSGVFERIPTKFQEYSNLGLLGFQLLNPDGSLQKTGFVFPSLLRRAFQITFVPLVRKYLSSASSPTQPEDAVVDYLKGALMILPARLVEELQLRFDGNYFMYHEEMDLAFQLKKHGKICLLDATPAGIHYGQNVEDVANPRVFLWRNQSLLYFVNKNYGSFQAKLFALLNIKVFVFACQPGSPRRL